MENETYTYAHCCEEDDNGHMYGCGMEYEFHPDAGLLRRWHDAVGLVTETSITETEWNALVAYHDKNCADDVR